MYLSLYNRLTRFVEDTGFSYFYPHILPVWDYIEIIQPAKSVNPQRQFTRYFVLNVTKTFKIKNIFLKSCFWVCLPCLQLSFLNNSHKSCDKNSLKIIWNPETQKVWNGNYPGLTNAKRPAWKDWILFPQGPSTYLSTSIYRTWIHKSETSNYKAEYTRQILIIVEHNGIWWLS